MSAKAQAQSRARGDAVRGSLDRLRGGAYVVLAYWALWFACDASAVALNGGRLTTWYPAVGIGFAFAVYFGPAVGAWEILFRLAAAPLLWHAEAPWQTTSALAIVSVGLQLAMAYPLRRLLLFEERFTCPKAQAMFLGTAFLGPLPKALALATALAYATRVTTPWGNLIHAIWVRDAIAILTVSPVALLILCPVVARGAEKLTGGAVESALPLEEGRWLRIGPGVMAWAGTMAAFILCLALGCGPSHYRYWFLSIPFLVFAMAWRGLETGLWLVPTLALGLSLLEAWHPSAVPPWEKETFLITVAFFSSVYGALLFERKRVKRLLGAANREALRADAAKSQFLSAASHELRTPLVTILGCARMARDLALPPERRMALAALAQGNAEKMLKLVDRILLLAHHPVQDPGRDLQRFDLRDFLAQAVDESMGKAVGKPVRIELSLDPSATRTVYADARKARLVLGELLDNAVKFTAAGVIRVEASLSREPGPSGAPLMQVDVTDSGAGIAADEHIGVFRLFHQQDQSAARPFGGLGAGLPYALLLAESMGGKVMLVRSAPRQGSRFRFLFPAA